MTARQKRQALGRRIIRKQARKAQRFLKNQKPKGKKT